MATHSSVLAWRIPGTGEPDGLPSMGWHRVRHDWSDLAAAAAVTDCDFNLQLRLNDEWCWQVFMCLFFCRPCICFGKTLQYFSHILLSCLFFC